MALRASLAGLDYTFTGADRNASSSAAADTALALSDMRTGQTDVTFNAGQVVRVRRARLISSGAPGLQPELDGTAASLVVLEGKGSPFAGQNSCKLEFAEWNEWEDKDFELAISEDGSSLGIQAGSEVTCDDFNIQDNFVGQAVYPVVELEAEVYIGG
jgi:hypothetical protein